MLPYTLYPTEDPNEFATRQYCLHTWTLNDKDKAVIERGAFFKLSYKWKLCKPDMGGPQKRLYTKVLTRTNGSALTVLDYFLLRSEGGQRTEAERVRLVEWARRIRQSDPAINRDGRGESESIYA